MKTRLKEAGPSAPVNIVGFNGVPEAGDILVTCEDEQMARDLASSRSRITRERDSAAYQAGLMQSVAATFAADGLFKEKREMCVVVKADVQGSAEALTGALRDLKLEDDEAIVTIKVLVSEAGEVSKSDVAIASVTPDTTIIAFNCAANYAATEDARALNIPIEYYSIVYDAIESVECRMQEVLSPTPEGQYVGKVTVQEVFNIGGTGNIAGSMCNDGYVKKGSNVRIMRGDKILAESKIKTLRNFKAEVDKIEAGDECGVGLIDFEEFQLFLLVLYPIFSKPGQHAVRYLLSKCFPKMNPWITEHILEIEMESNNRMREDFDYAARLKRQTEGWISGYTLKTKVYASGNVVSAEDDAGCNGINDDNDIKLSREDDINSGGAGIRRETMQDECNMEHEEDNMCTICLLTIEDGERIAHLSCGHLYHSECLSEWILKKNSCPLCQDPDIAKPIRSFETEDDAAAAGGNNNDSGSKSIIHRLHSHVRESILDVATGRGRREYENRRLRMRLAIAALNDDSS